MVLQFGKEACQERGVAVGYDARHNSHRYPRLVCMNIRIMGCAGGTGAAMNNIKLMHSP